MDSRELQHTHVENVSEFDRNPNAMSPEKFEGLKKIIAKHGCIQPIILRRVEGFDHEYEIVDGHHRYRAMREIGYEEVPFFEVDTDEAGLIELRLGTRRFTGELDLVKTAALLQDLQELGLSPDEMELTGYSPDEVDDLLDVLKMDDEEIDVLSDASMASIEEETKGKPDSSGSGSDFSLDNALESYTLTLEFSTREELQAVKRALRRASGPRGDLAEGLLALVD